MNISQKISEHKIFKKKPIVLMHIGSAGTRFRNWINISKNAILVSIDGNDSASTDKSMFKKIINDNSIISDKNGKATFYITKDPHCSSLLKPNKKILQDWYFAHRFKVIKKKISKVITINNLLKKYNLKYIDWLVVDVQGMDLKIIKNIKINIKNNISIIDIEPGFLDFYQKADKISDVFAYLSKKFEFSDMKFGNSYKIVSKNLSKFEKKILFLMNNKSKVYSNIIFSNKKNDLRNILLKILYLIESNKIFEARELLDKIKKKDKYLKELYDGINQELESKKIKFFLYSPFFLLKKYLKFNVY